MDWMDWMMIRHGMFIFSDAVVHVFFVQGKPIYLSICVYLSVCLSVYLSVSLSICLTVCLFV